MKANDFIPPTGFVGPVFIDSKSDIKLDAGCISNAKHYLIINV
jgi:hypothetical protein